MFDGDTRNNVDILRYLYQKFIVERAPKCMSKSGVCQYAPQTEGQIGCAVGCLLPEDVAKQWDKHNVGGLTEGKLNNYLEVKNLYSQFFNMEQLPFLMACQSWHDNCLTDGIYFSRAVLIGIAISFDMPTAYLM